jgi:RsiW-degrading membrane proteinase PrsW (M82 family)
VLFTIFLAIAVPITFLYVVHWLDLYGSDRPRIVLYCIGWGLVAFALSFLINRFCIDIAGLPRSVVSTRTAPFVEEILKAGLLVYLMRRGKLTYLVDGAIYGFACGIGFAVIENLRYIQLYPDNPQALVIVRDFSSALAHGTATAMTGIALGTFVGREGRVHAWRPLIVGLAAAMTLHYAWNNFAYFSPFGRFVTEWILVTVGLAGVAFVAAAILWGLQRERLQLRHSLGMAIGVSEGEASVVQHLDDLERLLKPIEARFGKHKRDAVAEFLHVEAQLGLARDLQNRTADAVLKTELDEQVTMLERTLDRERRSVGVYAMVYVRSIYPDATWSLWARLGHRLSKQRAMAEPVWRMVLAKLTDVSGGPEESMYRRLDSVLDFRSRAGHDAPMHVLHELPDAMQRYVHWVIQEVHVTVQHAAATLGHHEAHAHAMLNQLVSHGILHRAVKDGGIAFHARPCIDPHGATRPHLWQMLSRDTVAGAHAQS